MVRLHFWLTIVWIVLLIPTVLWWRNSILWVLIMSVDLGECEHTLVGVAGGPSRKGAGAETTYELAGPGR